MGNKNGLLSDLQLRRWLKDSQPLAKSDGDGLTFTVSATCRAAVERLVRARGRTMARARSGKQPRSRLLRPDGSRSTSLRERAPCLVTQSRGRMR